MRYYYAFLSYPAVYKVVPGAPSLPAAHYHDVHINALESSDIIYYYIHYIILKWAILHDEYFYFWYILKLIFLYFDCGTFTCNRVFLHCSTATFTSVKYLNAASSGGHMSSPPLSKLYCQIKAKMPLFKIIIKLNESNTKL